MNCTIEQKNRILKAIKKSLYAKMFDAPTIEKNIRSLGEGDFTLSEFLSILDKREFNDLSQIMKSLNLDPQNYLKISQIKKIENSHSILPDFSSGSDITDLFYNQNYLKTRFQTWVIPKLATASWIGTKEDTSYVKTDTALIKNLQNLQIDSFNELVEFLKKRRNPLDPTKFLLSPKQTYALFANGTVVNYNLYAEVMIAAANYFKSDKFSQITNTFSGKLIPEMPVELGSTNQEKKTNTEIIDNYFNMVLLNNFDFAINQFGPGIRINENYIGTFNTGEGGKYAKSVQSLTETHWSVGAHEWENSESHEDDLTKLLVGSIPAYKKDGVTREGMLEVKQLYLLGARIGRFELENYQYLKQNFPQFTSFNINPSKSLDFYIKLVDDKSQKGDVSVEKLNEVREILYSLRNFFKDNNIEEKEKNSAISLKNIITQVINNNKGGIYSYYNATGELEIKEMTNFDFQITAFNSWVFNKINETELNKYNVRTGSELEGLTDLDEVLPKTLLTQKLEFLDYNAKVQIGKLLGKRFGSVLGVDGFDIMIKNIQDLSKNNKIKFETVGDLRIELENLFDAAYQSHKLVIESKLGGKKVKGDEKVTEYIGAILKSPLFIAYRTGWLENYIIRPQMTIDTLTGEKIPTFKLANLTYKDLELYEVYTLNKPKESTFNSIFVEPYKGAEKYQNSPLFGTQTKLEMVGIDNKRNKSCDKATVVESFKSNFLFDFIKQLNLVSGSRKSSFGVQIGNYSDKGTILLKTISADYVHNGVKVISMSDENLKSLIRTQGYNFYNDAVTKIINDYKTVFGDLGELSNTSLKSININSNSSVTEKIKAFGIIDTMLQDFKNKDKSIYDINSLYKSRTGKNSPFMEELHYTSYTNGIHTNKQLLSTLLSFSSESNFKIFAKNVENKFISDYAELIDESPTLGIPQELVSDIKNVVSADQLNLPTFKLGENKQLKIYTTDKDTKEKIINPLIQKYIWLNALYRNEYLFLTGKGEYMHPHKLKNFLAPTNFDINSDDFWNTYNKETSQRLISMGKRNVMFTSTIESPIRKSKLGVPDKINHAVLQDHRDLLWNPSGNVISNIEVHNGSSFIDACYDRMLDESYPTKGYYGVKKQFATFITPNGAIVKKDAESIISNWNILASQNADIKLKNKKKQMLDIKIGSHIIPDNVFDLSTRNANYYFKSGKDVSKITHINITTDKDHYLWYSITSTTGDNQVTSELKPLDTLYNLWESFGGEYSCDKEGNFDESSNDLLYRIMTTLTDTEGEYFLKGKLIHVISNHSAIKSGGLGVNSKSTWLTSQILSYETHESRFMGPQLNANHNLDDSEIKEVTQVISALAQNRDTMHLAEEAYRSIAQVIENSAKEYQINIENWIQDPNTKIDLYKFLAKKFVFDIQHTKGDTIAKIITQSLQDVTNIPFSNQNFFSSFVKTIITDLNNNFISRYYSGTGAILVPSHGIVQVYDIPVMDENGNIIEYRQALHNDLVKEALDSEIEGATNEEKIHNYIKKLLPDQPITADKVEFGDTIRRRLSKEEIDSIINNLDLEFMTQDQGTDIINTTLEYKSLWTLNTPQEYYKFKELYKEQLVDKVISIPRDLKPTTFTWTVGNIQQSIFDTDSVRLRTQYENGTLSQEDTEFVELLKLRFPNLSITKVFAKWTQRNLQLLENKKIMRSLAELRTLFNNQQIVTTLFDTDDLLKDFNNVKIHYLNPNISKDIVNYQTKAAELILGDIYQSTFDREDNDSMFTIKQMGSKYFEDKLKAKYDTTGVDPNYDVKLLCGKTTVYLEYAQDNITNGSDSVIIESRPDALDPKKDIYFIRDKSGKELLYFTKEQLPNIKVKNINGQIVVRLKTYNKSNEIIRTFKSTFDNFIYNNNRTISDFIPLENTKSLKQVWLDKDTQTMQEKQVSSALISLKRLNKFYKTNYNVEDSDITRVCNLIISDLSKKQFIAWEKSHEFISARIPAQSMQSFMPMKNIAYFNTKRNEAYVSVYQIWFQGSDFDVDKAYLLGSGFKKDATFDTSSIFNYLVKDELDIIEKMPLPLGKTVTYSTNPQDLNLTEEFNTFKLNNAEILTEEAITKMQGILNDSSIKDKSIYINKPSLSVISSALVKIKNSNSEFVTLDQTEDSNLKNLFLSIINAYNADTTYLKSENLVKNSIISKIKEIILSPTNQLLASTPVDEAMDEFKKATEHIGGNYNISGYSMLGMFKQQYDASVGKDDVGIAANGLKVFFALSSYYNNYYKSNSTDFSGFDNKLFRKSMTINGTTYSFGSISDVSLSDSQKASLMNVLQLSNADFRNSDAATYLSGFTSAATDNAKELIMAKLNASVELASVHIYLMILGLTPKEIVNVMTSPIVTEIVNLLDDDIFTKEDAPSVFKAIGILSGKYIKSKNNYMLTELESFKSMFNGAQELKHLAKLLGVNQKTSAKIQEIHNFLGTFEKIIFSRENAIFGEELLRLKTDLATTAEIDKSSLSPINYTNTLQFATEKIIENSNGRFSELDKPKIIELLKQCSNVKVQYIDYNGQTKTRSVSILGGEFDYRYYVYPGSQLENGTKFNDNYRDLTKKYYNLIKDTFNVFDVIDSVPHFKGMIDSVIQTHLLLSLSSFKYNASFNLLKDFTRNYGYNIKDIDNVNVKFLMGNRGLPLVVGDNEFTRMSLYVDNMIKYKWLETSPEIQKINFSLANIQNYMRRAGINKLTLYTDDDAFKYEDNNPFTRVLTVDEKISEDDTFNINLNTNYGIANFKVLMDKVMVNLLIADKSSKIKDLLRVELINNLFGLKGASIVPSFNISEKAIPAIAEKGMLLSKLFNTLDSNVDPALALDSGLSWKKLFYLYNLLVNNDKYGAKRLTPLLEGYMKEPDSLANNFIQFGYRIDSGQLSLFNLDTDSVKKENDTRSKDELLKEAELALAKDILYYAYNTDASLIFNNDLLSNKNPDFVMLRDLSIDRNIKLDKSEHTQIRELLSKNNFLIQFKCE